MVNKCVYGQKMRRLAIVVSAKPATSVRCQQERQCKARITASILLTALGFLTVGCTQPLDGTAVSDPELPFVRGYRSDADACKLTGESSFTIDFLDDSADLVSCPEGSSDATSLIAEAGAVFVAEKNGFTLFSVPRR